MCDTCAIKINWSKCDCGKAYICSTCHRCYTHDHKSIYREFSNEYWWKCKNGRTFRAYNDH